jgi:oxygen-independent coproporphyrinogen-3 oxidase
MYWLYIHVPFCASKCLYCDFYSLPGKQHLIDRYIDSILLEAQRCKGDAFKTLYIGGGTPSLLGPSGLKRLMTGLRGTFNLGQVEEATIEANPDSSSSDFLRASRDAGFMRISIGVQSLNDGELKKAGRAHDSAQAIQAVKSAFEAGFDDVSADIMIGLPGQTPESLQETLHKVLKTGVTHISAYCLSVEEGTPFADNLPADLPGDDEEAMLYGLVRDTLKAAGFVHYEVSNFALPGRQCRHNLNYWRGGDYLGLGPAAASHIKGRRLKNESNLEKYIEDPLHIEVEMEELDEAGKIGEEAILRLRLLDEGLDISEMAEKWGEKEVATLAAKLESMASLGTLERQGSRYRLPYDRVLTSNSILVDILGLN